MVVALLFFVMPYNQRLKMKKIELVLNHLQTQGSITPHDALLQYGYYRLSDGIYKLRNRGHNIVTIIEDRPNGDEYARYVLLTESVA